MVNLNAVVNERVNKSKSKLFPTGGGAVDPKVYIFKKSIHIEKRLQNGFL